MALSYYEQLTHPLWESKKIEILNIHNHKCAVCGTNLHKLEIHHLCYFPDLLLWEYDNELMIAVCKKHHYQLTYDMPKITGIIAFECLKKNIDPIALSELITLCKDQNK